MQNCVYDLTGRGFFVSTDSTSILFSAHLSLTRWDKSTAGQKEWSSLLIQPIRILLLVTIGYEAAYQRKPLEVMSIYGNEEE